MRGYLKQQFEYGKAEALLERKWPERYNRVGHLAWAGRVYGAPLAKVLGGRWKIYYGTWGTGPVPVRLPARARDPRLAAADARVVPGDRGCWRGLSLLGIAVDAAAAGGAAAGRRRRRARLQGRARRRARERRVRRPARASASAGCGCAPALLYMLQPAARLAGRLRHGLSPWRRRSAPRLGLPDPAHDAASGASAGARPTSACARLETALRRSGGVVFSGGDFERWDLHVRGGMLGSMRLRMAVEEHGGGRQLLRIRSWPRFSRIGAGVALGFAALAAGAALDGRLDRGGGAGRRRGR